jgi:type VI secretion system secreted protein VgrG
MSDTQGQGKRLLSLQTDLGAGVLDPVSFHAEESLGMPYTVTVEAVSSRASIDPDAILYKTACLKITHGTAQPRILHGLVRSFAATGSPVRDSFSYTLTFVPRLWFMGQTSDCRIFCNKSIADIISTICGDSGQAIDVKVFGDKPQKPYVTQYNETDLTFLSRLAEEAGYFFYFTHEEGNHTLVLTNQNQGFPQGAKPAMTVTQQGGGTNVLTAWHRIGSTAHGKFHVRDYDAVHPATLPEDQQQTTLKTAGALSRDVFEWPALSLTQAEAAGRTRIKLGAAEAEAGLIEALGANPLLSPGSRFTVTQDPFDASRNVDYIVRSISSSGHDHSWVAGGRSADYGNRIVAFKAATAWREKVVTPRPTMSGIHSAVVLGNAGEEIHADEYGRVKVRFFWDHRQDATADSACWVRVIQPWAGNTWGWQHLPRVGTEVAVAFLDGDPDRPVIIGGLYNGDMMPVFPIPSEQTKSGFRSRSTTQGSGATFSELSFDDNKGQEKVFLHAEKDMTVEIEHDQSVTIDNSLTVTVKNGRTTTVKAQGDSLTVEKGGITITASADDIAMKAGQGSIQVQAMKSIQLKVGDNTITVDNQGVTVSAMQIKLQGQSMVQVKGPMTQVNADGMLVLKGGVMTLN